MRGWRRIAVVGGALAFVALGPACYVRPASEYYGSGYYGSGYYDSGYAAAGWILVEPGVYVSEWGGGPVYWTNGAYWWPYDGYWYTSVNPRRGWGYARTVPAPVSRPYAQGRWGGASPFRTPSGAYAGGGFRGRPMPAPAGRAPPPGQVQRAPVFGGPHVGAPVMRGPEGAPAPRAAPPPEPAPAPQGAPAPRARPAPRGEPQER